MAPKESEQVLSRKFREICSDLNLDRAAADEAYNSFQRIQMNYTLEGNKLHWLACALYVACRKGTTPTVGGRVGYVEGNCVSLTRLLRSCKLSLVEFFKKMGKWSEMASLSHEMRDKLLHLERNFNVSAVIFNKFGMIFKHLFKTPAVSPVKQGSRSRKQSRKQNLTSGHVFQFCWTLFVHVKANFKMISDDLVNSYHLLLACIDFCYSNILVAENARDLLNPDFPELPAGFNEENFVAPEPVPCIVEALCNKWEGICIDAKGIKEHWLKPCIKRMVDKRIFRCRNPTHFLGFLDLNYFEPNLKAISREYDQLLLSSGDSDERVFLSDNANDELGTPCTDFEKSLDDRMQSVQKIIKESKPPAPTTPLSNRHFLANRENMGACTPVTNAIQSVSRLQSLLCDCKTEPSQALLDIFLQCESNPTDTLTERVKLLGDKFLKSYQDSDDDERFPKQKRILDSGVMLYYKCLEKIMAREKKKWSDSEKGNLLSSSLSHELFHVSLFACCMEIVLFVYNSDRLFPWICDLYADFNNIHFQPIHFYRVIELIVRDEDGLSRDIVKHLNTVEEQILDTKAWKSESVLWDMIKANGSVPSCKDVSLTVSLADNTMMSPIQQRSIRQNDRFVSPAGTARRRLFDTAPTNSNNNNSTEQQTQPQIIQIIPAQTSTGEVRFLQFTLQPQAPQAQPSQTESALDKPIEPPKVNKTGSLGLFFRKVYHLAWLRLRDLSDKLSISGEDLRRKIWTCFEYSVRNNTELLRDRHLDQLLMCAVYSICKVTGNDRNFQDIMKCYRQQPQAHSQVYRSVLLSSKKRRDSASSENSRNSGSNSPCNEEKERIRSSSTLPVPHPNSQPPTPTRLAGGGANFEYGEERADLIQFYNIIYVPEVKQYIMKFNAEAGLPSLSPLPRLAANSISPYRRVSKKHLLYVSPLKNNAFPPSPKRPMQYHFLRSPAKDLRAINSMMRQNASGSEKRVIRKILQDDNASSGNSTTRRQNYVPRTISVINDIRNERQNDGVDEDDDGDVEME